MIKTKKFQLTQTEYFSFIIRILFKKRWHLYALIWLFSFGILFNDKRDYFINSIMVFGFIFPLIPFFTYWRFANSKENKNFFREIQHEISPDIIISKIGEISKSTFEIQNFIKVLELKDLYLLYFSKGQCLYLPKRIFETSEDENWFRNEVFLKIKNR